MSEFLFSIENTSVEIKNNKILDNITCQIPSSRITTIIGSSGAGKSTLLRTLVRLLDFSGSINYHDRPIKDTNVRDLRRKICYVPQVAEMFPGTVEDNILWARTLWKLPITENFLTDLLKSVDLDPSLAQHDGKDLSVGQKQRICFARSLALEPDVLLLDEPDSALDAISKESFEKLIFSLRKKNPALTIIMVTHNLQQANRLGDYVILLDKGKLIAQGDSKKFFSDTQSLSESDLLRKLINTSEDDQ